jgi:hypothetical protein
MFAARAWCRCLAFVLCGVGQVCAQQPPPAPAEPAPAERPAAPTPEQIDLWIKDLDSDKFQVREQAVKQLSAAGAVAIEPLAQAAGSSSRETSDRALEVLKTAWKSGDGVLQSRAKAALEDLAKSENAALARRAKQVLQPAAEQPIPPQAIPGGRIQIAPGAQIQIGGNIQIGGPGIRMIRVQNVNGKRTIDADEDGKQVHIEDDPQKGLEISVTEKMAGQPKTSKYSAKNAEELKKAHPEIEKLYQKYAAQPALPLQIQIQGQNLPVVPLPVAPDRQQKALAQIESARKLLAEATEQLKKQGSPAEVQRALEQLETAYKELSAAQQALQGQP